MVHVRSDIQAARVCIYQVSADSEQLYMSDLAGGQAFSRRRFEHTRQQCSAVLALPSPVKYGDYPLSE